MQDHELYRRRMERRALERVSDMEFINIIRDIIDLDPIAYTTRSSATTRTNISRWKKKREQR